MDELTKFDAIRALCPKAVFVIRGDVLEFIKANGDTKPSDSEIDAKLAELKTAYDNNKYQRDRAAAFPSIQDQLDMQYWDKKNGTTTWVDAVAKVKSDNPKP